MKIPVFPILLFFAHSVYAQNEKPFSTLIYDHVFMYNFKNGEGLDSLYIIDLKGELSGCISQQIELAQQEVKDFNSKIESKKSYGEATMDCFNAHLGIVYYLKNKVVAHITISPECRRLHSSIEIPEQQQGKVSVGTDTYYTATGLSDSFISYVNSLMKKYRFLEQ